MKKLAMCLGFMLLSVGVIFGETAIEKADRLHEEELHDENKVFIQEAIAATADPMEKAQLYWRLSRTVLEIGDLLKVREGIDENVLLETFLEGEGYADRAIELDPDSYWAYYWKSANIGRWGEVKGILNALFKAKPMHELLRKVLSIFPDHPDSFYVLGIMYRKVPGKPISFGSSTRSVSLARKALDAQRAEYESGAAKELKLSYFMELARSLWDRDWSAAKRAKEVPSMARDFRNETDVLEKHFYYEGSIDIPDVSDREEAVDIMTWVVSEFRAKPALKKSEKIDFDEALADLEGWTK
ncbi:MAG: hypothetical protein JW852_04205 [Spirochaetales bacterium]|nr:hypothetical protein [Spirochaetales bacterium]